MTEKSKTIDELKDKVHSGLELLSDEELSVLFEDAEQIAQSTPTETQTPIEPSVAPASAEPAPPAEETPKGQANLLDLMPEKFKEKDEAASLAKMLKALQEQESELTRKSQELSQLQNVVHELSKPREERQTYQSPQSQKTQPVVQPQVAEEPEVDDLAFLDSPVANTRAIAEAAARKVSEEVARRVSVEQLRDYDTFALRRSTFEKFRSEHSDFDSIKGEFSEACKIHPEWDNDINGLPKLYDYAKTLASARKASASQSTPQGQATPAIDIEKLKAEIRAEVEASSVEKAKQAILAEIKNRRAAAGIVSTSSGTTPAERVAVGNKTTPLTPEEKTLQDMIDSGPKTLDHSLGEYGTILSLERHK